MRNNVYTIPVDKVGLLGLVTSAWYQRSAQREQKRLADLDNLVREVIGQSCLFPIPGPVRGSDGEIESDPTVLDCGSGSGIWIERLLEERQGNVEVSQT